MNTVSKMILNDWIRGKIPFYTLPSETSEQIVAKQNEAEEEEVCNCDSCIETTRSCSSEAKDEKY